jgi:hypothetical protein
MMEKIEERFGKMTVMPGKKDIFWGMYISYLDNGTAEIRMAEYLKEAIKEFGETISRSAATPTKRDLFEINEDSATLDKTRSEIFPSVPAKLLYVSHRGRLDIQLAIAFLYAQECLAVPNRIG